MAKSLGTLTLDLIAKVGAFTGPLDRASQEAKKRNAEIAKSFNNLAKGVGVAIGSIPTILTAMVVASGNSAKEISNQAALAGLGTTEFQKYAAGARTVGVEQDKLSDILKDTNDKLGDFANTGGGALKDFFDNIAPKVGLAADSFKKLNSKDALALYVTSLEKANVSQQEMTFYMEAIASDSTALVPLLRNGGKAFDELGQAAMDAGVVMDETTIAAAKQFGIELSGLGQYISSAQTILAAEFLPVLAQFTKDMNTSAKEAGGLKGVVGDLGDKIVEVSAFVANAGDGVIRVFKIVAETLVGMFARAAGRTLNLTSQINTALAALSFGETSREFKASATQFAKDAQIQFGVAALAAASINENLETPLVGDRFKEYVASAKKAAAEITKATQGATLGNGSGVDPAAAEAAKKVASETAANAKKIQAAFESTETNYQRQIALINTTGDARKDASEAAKLQFEFESGKLADLSDQQKERLRGLAKELDAKKAIAKASEDEAKLTAFGSNLKDSNRTIKQGYEVELAGAGSGDKLKERLKADLQIQQEHDRQVADLFEQRNSGDISQELYDKETALLEEALAERMVIQQDYYNQVDEAQNSWMDGVSSAWQNYVDAATDYSAMAADATASILDNAKSGLSSFMSDVVSGAESADDALGDLVANFAKSTLQALSDMAAQWLIYQAVQLVVGKTTQSTAGIALVANAQATAFQASLAAYASTAAIPVVGPAMAPAAALSAAAATAPMVASVASAALTGMAHNGMDNIPREGTWLLDGGERVLNPNQNRDFTEFLSNERSGNGGGGGNVVFSPTITVQAQPGTSSQEAKMQGDTIYSAMQGQFTKFLQSEMRQGGLLWRRGA